MIQTLRTLDDLVAAGLVADGARAALEPVAERYAIAVTPAMDALIKRDDPSDPIRLQFIPDPREVKITKNEIDDPIDRLWLIELNQFPLFVQLNYVSFANPLRDTIPNLLFFSIKSLPFSQFADS